MWKYYRLACFLLVKQEEMAVENGSAKQNKKGIARKINTAVKPGYDATHI